MRSGFAGMQLEGSNALRPADAAGTRAPSPAPPLEPRPEPTYQRPTPSSTPPLSSEAGVARSPDTIMIHVCDEARGVNRDFPCSRATLLQEMKYFRAYLTSPPGEEVDISVHCDVHIFEWLVKYIEAPGAPPRLDAASVVSILISSDFLEMDRLVHHWCALNLVLYLCAVWFTLFLG
jgi:hypothetical protein